MNTKLAAIGTCCAALLTVIGAAAGCGAEEIKAGKWQFTTQIQMPAPAQSAAGARPGGDQGMTLTACIDAANPVPTEGHCTLDKLQRNGAVVTWSMTCNTPQGPIPSAGSARYWGDTMEATLTARVPGPGGQPVDTPGRISGHYLGACDAR